VTALAIDRLNVAHGDIPILRDLSLEVGPGEIVALLGPNGAGKTTLLRAISGLHPVSSGSITFSGRAIANRSAYAIARLGLSHIPEGRGILPGLTVMENLRLGVYASGALRDPRALDRVLALFPRLAERRSQLAGMLSGGEQQMLSIGRSMLAKPKLLLIDELSLGLAPKVSSELLALLTTLAVDGMSVLVVEQNVQEMLKAAHRAYVLVQGRIVFAGKSADLLSREDVMALYHGLSLD
jgi:branched-chain amino acid transport system ATP-binding protein